MAEKEKTAGAEKGEEKKVVKPTKKAIDTWKKKKWFTILASREFSQKPIGETPAEKPRGILGRVVKVNLFDLTSQRQKRHITVFFRASDVQGTNVSTILAGHEIHPSHLARVIRRRSSKMEVVQNVVSSDGKNIRVKTVVVSARKIEGKKRTAIRNAIADIVKKNCSGKPADQLIQELIFGLVSANVFKKAKEIAPVKRAEIVKSFLAPEPAGEQSG